MSFKEKYQVAIIGTGFAGVCMAIKLLEAGINDFVILEKADDIGGTWRDNTYPGAACDVSSHLYSFSFEPNPNWSRMFSGQKEIYEYLKHCVVKYGLESYIQYGSEVMGGNFNQENGEWQVLLKDKPAIKARFWVNGMGPLNRAVYPEIPGLQDFEGKMFHSSNWDHKYDIRHKKVAVVGTGASSIQITPAIAPDVEKLYVFQRTPAWVLHKPDREMNKLEKWLFKKVPFIQKLYRWRIYWFNELPAYFFVYHPTYTKIIRGLGLKQLKKQVPNKELREKLTPKYMPGCKRILLSNNYYPTFMRPNVELVTEGIESIGPKSITTKGGESKEVDAIVLCTGFMAAEFPENFNVMGINGKTLNEEWKSAPEAYLGTTVSGFPNMYLIIGPNTGLGHNSMIYMIEAQVTYILDAIQKAMAKGSKYMDVKKPVQETYNEEMQDRLQGTVWNSGCVSWYLTKAGKNTSVWPGFTFEFSNRTKKVKAEDYDWVESQ